MWPTAGRRGPLAGLSVDFTTLADPERHMTSGMTDEPVSVAKRRTDAAE